MTQLTLRGFDPELERRLRALARRNATSLNQAALQLMRRGAGLVTRGRAPSAGGAALARFAGRMTAAEARAIDRVISESREADLDLQT
ncbi:MAG: hypothetical protein L0Y32_03865 [Nevskiales bacterium]|nr:hypothetical protein [Nevskiales bacterium]